MLECNKKKCSPLLLVISTRMPKFPPLIFFFLQYATLWISLGLLPVTCSICCVYMLICVMWGCSSFWLCCLFCPSLHTHSLILHSGGRMTDNQHGYCTVNEVWTAYMNHHFYFLKWCFSFWLSTGESHGITNKWLLFGCAPPPQTNQQTKQQKPNSVWQEA